MFKLAVKQSIYGIYFENKQKIIKDYNWEYFISQINQKYTDQEAPKIYSQGKIDVKLIFGFMKTIFVFYSYITSRHK
ncbi:hypothetical protein BUZ14_12685 [Staphylococcus gallinarum]|uniref:Uncharacterized protein n=1 Tax=Staphylococcus gallinarum TaxID=1293 RepID=A0A3A0VU05_STAGA|nr:hypothetical protein BUZ14_12685 [Staphylococcus gallinarum]